MPLHVLDKQAATVVSSHTYSPEHVGSVVLETTICIYWH
jgi:hypothetical protein